MSLTTVNVFERENKGAMSKVNVFCSSIDWNCYMFPSKVEIKVLTFVYMSFSSFICPSQVLFALDKSVSGVSGSIDIGKKKILLLKGKEKEIPHVRQPSRFLQSPLPPYESVFLLDPLHPFTCGVVQSMESS